MESSQWGAAELANLFRVVLQPDWVSDQWGGPIQRIGEGPIYTTWAIQGEDQRRHYVSDEQAASWDSDGIDWRAIAFRNALKLAAAGGFGWKRDETGRIFMRVMLNDDGLGPSRLFVPHLFNKELGDDYCVAVPELTCAVAFRRTMTSEQGADVADMISGCYAVGTTPVSDQRFSATDFWGA